jgi:hypothetical protein
MKITLDQETLATAVINHLRSVGVQSDILGVDFRYTRVPYTVFAEVELIEAKAPKSTKVTVVTEPPKTVDPNDAHIPYVTEPLVDPATLTPEEVPPDEPPPETPAAPLFGGG